jgi:hypothetical protein
LTQKVLEAAEFFGLTLLDHIIIGTRGVFRFLDRGLLEEYRKALRARQAAGGPTPE